MKELIIDKYRDFSGRICTDISRLPGSGSGRIYFRITDTETTLIAVFNPDKEENDAFTGFTAHFRSLDLPVPEVYEYFPEDRCYFLEDLGETSLYNVIQKKNEQEAFDDELINLYRESLAALLLFQVKGIVGLDLSLCYPHRNFGRKSMQWDLNYFKYMFLKLVSAPFNENMLEKDFETLTGFLLESDNEYFLYRDFQSSNIMIRDHKPYFIDYQGGRKGSPQYDPASLLYDPKAELPEETRNSLLDYYISLYHDLTGKKEAGFRKYFNGFVLIRLLQAMGAFGYRGLYENKPGFTQSILPGIRLLTGLFESGSDMPPLPELSRVIMQLPGLDTIREIERRLINN